MSGPKPELLISALALKDLDNLLARTAADSRERRQILDAFEQTVAEICVNDTFEHGVEGPESLQRIEFWPLVVTYRVHRDTKGTAWRVEIRHIGLCAPRRIAGA